jgi:hypothetical protein
MNVLETEWWSLALPPEWWADTEEDSILVGDQDDVGCIEISTLHKDEGVFDQGTVLSIAQSESEWPLDWGLVVQEETAVREWYVANGALLLFITYSCAQENGGMDDAAVDELLDTLMVLGELP